ncbi:MAG: class II fructose-bisphosphate aldolase [Firmicutes bacterium]|nr:class II fructose-bisphosphate aldolase [Bacillota bacterium]
MPLTKAKYILAHADENKYGVLSVNTFNYETVKWVVTAAELENVPVMVQFYPGLDSYIPKEIIVRAAVILAERAAVPVAVHLDHSVSYEIALSGIKCGFPSVMVDGSALPYEQNVGLTFAVVRAARVFGVDVEAELGHVGSGADADMFTNRDFFTDPEQARDFTARTGCGSLAVAVGNAHGAYVQTPVLDFKRIEALRKAAGVPLVLHGCSDIPDWQIREAVKLGVAKFNIATEYFRAIGGALAERAAAGAGGDALALISGARERAVGFLREKIRLVNPNGATIS